MFGLSNHSDAICMKTNKLVIRLHALPVRRQQPLNLKINPCVCISFQSRIFTFHFTLNYRSILRSAPLSPLTRYFMVKGYKFFFYRRCALTLHRILPLGGSELLFLASLKLCLARERHFIGRKFDRRNCELIKSPSRCINTNCNFL